MPGPSSLVPPDNDADALLLLTPEPHSAKIAANSPRTFHAVAVRLRV